MDRLLVIKLDNGSSFEAKAPDGVDVKLHDTCVFRRDFYTQASEPPSCPADSAPGRIYSSSIARGQLLP